MEWLDIDQECTIETYKRSRKRLTTLDTSEYSDNEKSHVSAMIRDLDYSIEWLERGHQPGNRRGAERLAAYQREIPMEIMDKYAKRPEPKKVVSLADWERMEYILSMLTDRERECYEMHIGGMYSTREIGRELGIRMQTVCENIKRAENKIKRYKTKPMPLLLDIVV